MTEKAETIVVHKNRNRAFWALVIVGFMALVSLLLLITGLLSRSGVLWAPVSLGVVGLLGFGASAVLIVRIMRSPWHLALDPAGLSLHTPAYLLSAPWPEVAGIVVDEVNWRPGCALLFEDPAAIARGTRFLHGSDRPDAITDAEKMLARMQQNYESLGYHLGIPGRILELGPEELAELLTRARTGALWPKEGES